MHQLLFEAATTLYTEALLRPLQFHWSTSENVHFQGAEEEALVPDQDRHPSTLVASEQHTHGDRTSTAPGGQAGCLAWADPLPSSRHIYRGMFFSQAFWELELKTAYWWIVSEQQRKRLIDTCHFLPSLA